MGFYIRKRIRFLPSVWINLGKNGPSLSMGFGMFRYRQKLYGENKKTEPYRTVPEPSFSQYAGCVIYIIALVFLIISIYTGFFQTGLYIFIGIIFIGSLFFIIGKENKKENFSVIQVTDEESLKSAITNLNNISEKMDNAVDKESLIKLYDYARKQLYQLPPTIELNGMGLKYVELNIMSQYAEKLKSLSQSD